MGRLSFLAEDFQFSRQQGKVPISYAGMHAGYFVVVEIDEVGTTSHTYVIRVGATLDEADHSIEHLQEHVSKLKGVESLEILPHMIAIAGPTRMTKGKLRQQLGDIIRETINKLMELHASPGDFLNGDNDDTVALYRINGRYSYLSADSHQQVSAEIAETVSANALHPRSILSGLPGALAGAAVGAVLWGILLYFGFYAWFAAVIGVHLAFQWYKSNNGSMSLPGALTVTGIVIGSLLVANVLTYAIVIYRAVRDFGITLGDILGNFTTILSEADLVSPFMLDSLLGIGIATIYAGVYVYRLYTTSRYENTIDQA